LFGGQEESLPKIELRGVTERDVDLLLLEELVAQADFRDWFGIQAGLEMPQSLAGAARSVVTSTGESDLEVTYCRGELRTRLLVENKIDAAFQRRQADRYAERAQAYLARRECEKVVTLVIAPRSYADSVKGFDRTITYEAVRDWFANAATGDSRSLYKLHLLDAAIARGDSGWKMVPDPAATGFWQGYWKQACAEAPALHMPRPGQKPATSSFIVFKGHGFPKGIALLHKVPYGNVDLQFSGQAERIDEFAATYEGTLEEGMTIAPANKSVAVRIVVEPIALESEITAVEWQIRMALQAALRLLSWYKRHVAKLPPNKALNPTGGRGRPPAC
jgi:hypothetical protein